MKHLAIVTAMVITTLSAACVRTENRLTFDSSGQFKVLQLTDLHLQDFHPDRKENQDQILYSQRAYGRRNPCRQEIQNEKTPFWRIRETVPGHH